MTDLYGGSIQAKLPDGVIDVSDFRQIPDSQELFLIEKSNGLDMSIIFDLLEKVDASSLAEVISVHLDDIVEGVPLFLAPLESVPHPNCECEAHSFLVKPAPSKSETDSAKLFMFIFLIRLEKVGTDVLVTMNVPVETGDVTQELFQQEVDSILSGGPTTLAESYKILRETALSFKVTDWSLFG